MKGSYKKSKVPPPLTPARDWSDPKPVLAQRPAKTQHDVKVDPKKESVRRRQLSGIQPQSPKPRPSFLSQNKLELDALRERIRKGEPLLTSKQIRRIENPFYMSVILELDAIGYPESSEYIQELNSIDYDLHEYENAVTPFLRNSKDVLKVLCIGLKKAEDAKREGNTESEAMSMLGLARHFSADGMKDWYWLANEVFQRCVDIIAEYTGDHGEKEATVRYIFAKFLFKKKNQLNDAEAHIMVTMGLSEGRSWNLSEILDHKEDYLYFQSCYLLHEILLAAAAKIRNENPMEAIELCRRALRHVDETQKHPEMEKAMFQLIMSYEAANDLPNALTLLEKYMNACKKHGEIEDLCHGHLMFANCYRLNNTWKAKENLEEVIKIAELNNLPVMKVTAHSRIVQYFLEEMPAKELVEHAVVAYVMYTQLRMAKNAEEMRCLVGITAAQAMIPQYVSVLLNSENVDSSQFNTFMNWKTFRKPFVAETALIQPESDILNTLKPRMDKVRQEEQEYYRIHALYEQTTEPHETRKASVTTNAATSVKSKKSLSSETQASVHTSS